MSSNYPTHLLSLSIEIVFRDAIWIAILLDGQRSIAIIIRRLNQMSKQAIQLLQYRDIFAFS